MQRKHELSILIPTYNHVCVELVKGLLEQARRLGISHEIIVADDGSTDQLTVLQNQSVNQLEGCRCLMRTENVGRARIRNVLAQAARYAYLLFIDSDMTLLSDHYLERYLNCDADEVIDGGISVGGNAEQWKGNLRYRYEKTAEPEHTAERRQLSPYQHIHTANLLVRRDIMLAHPFDERFRHYGYEDVLFGKTMKEQGIGISHIDNPLGFCTFEPNAHFVLKTEEGLRTLHEFRTELTGYSSLLTAVSKLSGVMPVIRCWHRLMGPLERRHLCGRHPSLRVFGLYKLGYYAQLKSNKPS